MYRHDSKSRQLVYLLAQLVAKPEPVQSFVS